MPLPSPSASAGAVVLRECSPGHQPQPLTVGAEEGRQCVSEDDIASLWSGDVDIVLDHSLTVF